MYFCEDIAEFVSKSKDYFEKPLLLQLYEGPMKQEYVLSAPQNKLILLEKPRISICLKETISQVSNVLYEEKKNTSNNLIYEAILCCSRSVKLKPKNLVSFENEIDLTQIFFAIKVLHSNKTTFLSIL